MKFKKLLAVVLCAVSVLSASVLSASAATVTHTVQRGDSLWRIAVKYEVGLSEIKSANPHIKNYRLGNFGEGDLGVTIAELK